MEGKVEGKMEGKVEGKAEAMREVFSLLRQGYSVDEAEKLLTKQEAAHFGYAQ